MTALFLILGILFARVFQVYFNKTLSNLLDSENDNGIFYIFIQILCACAISFIFVLPNISSLKFTLLPTVLAGLAGISIAVALLATIKVMQTGTMALTTIFSTAGLLIPSITGIFLFNEALGIYQWSGLALFFFAAFLLITSSKSTYGHFSVKTFLLLILLMFSEGTTMLLQKYYGIYCPEANVAMFSFVSFLIPTILIGSYLLFAAKSSNKSTQKSIPKTIYICCFTLGLCVCVISQLATYAGKILPSAILFAVSGGGSVIIGAILGAILFREKLTVKSVFGVILGIAALLIIRM